MTAGDLVCLEYTYSGATIKNTVVASATFEPYTEDAADPPVLLTMVQAIAKIVDVDGTLEAEPIARNNFALVDFCENAKIRKVLTPR